jgi:hypothetical protein
MRKYIYNLVSSLNNPYIYNFDTELPYLTTRSDPCNYLLSNPVPFPLISEEVISISFLIALCSPLF